MSQETRGWILFWMFSPILCPIVAFTVALLLGCDDVGTSTCMRLGVNVGEGLAQLATLAYALPLTMITGIIAAFAVRQFGDGEDIED